MSNIEIGFSGVAVVMVLMAARVPIAFALGLTSFFGIWLIRGERAAYGTLGSLPFDFAASWTLSAVPMFLLMGAIAFHTGLTGTLYSAARLWLHRLPGGLAVATNLASAGFAAASGSSLATTAAMGRLAIPEMLSSKYDKGLAAGTVAAAGTLGALIPPSIAFVIYGWFTEQPVSVLLIAGILPGVLTASVYTSMIIIRCHLNPSLAPTSNLTATTKEKIDSLKEVWPLPVLIFGVIGSIYGGIATPTEAGALGALLALILGFLRGGLSKNRLIASVTEALSTTASIFLVGIGAVLFTRFLAMSGVPVYLSEIFSVNEVSDLAVVGIMIFVYLILGMFLDPIGIMLLTLPIFLPIFKTLGIDLIWIGVLVVKLVEIGLLTPPVGLNAYVVKNVVGDTIPLSTIFRGLLWFLVCEAFIMALLVYFPEISLFLTRLM